MVRDAGSVGPGRRRSLPFIEDRFWESFEEVRRRHGLTWNDVFRRFDMYRNGIEYIFSAPGEMTNQLKLDLNTVMGLINTWINNIRDNWYCINECPDVSKLRDEFHNLVKITDNDLAVVVGAGPSLYQRKSLDVLKWYQNRVTIISTLHSLKWCLDAGVVPDIVTIVDSNPVMADFIDYDIVKKHANVISPVFHVSTDPGVLKLWHDIGGHKPYFFMSGIPGNLVPNIDTFLSILLKSTTALDTGGNSGTFCYSLACYLGFKNVALVGMDLSYPKGYPYEKTQYYNAYSLSIGTVYKDKSDMIEQCYTDYHHDCFGVDCYYDFVYGVFRDSLFEIAKYNKEHNGVRLFNCTEGGSVHLDGVIECRPLREVLEEFYG